MRLAAIATALALLSITPAHAEPPQTRATRLAACSTLTDRLAEMIRAGELERARQSRPALERCLKLQRAERDRAMRDLDKRHNDLVRKLAGQSN